MAEINHAWAVSRISPAGIAEEALLTARFLKREVLEGQELEWRLKC
jgi:hypothetical protein